MVTTLYLIRHGETDSGGTKRYHGSIDIPLSEKGRQQIGEKTALLQRYLSAATLSKYLSYLRDVQGSMPDDTEEKNERPLLSAVYCSGLSRAMQSAEIIAGPFGLKPLPAAGLRERSFGIWEGMTFSEIKERYPKEFAAWADNPLVYAPVEGETTLAVRDRVIGAIDDILKTHRGEHIAVVAHGGVNRIILCHILGIPLQNIFRIEQDYAALNIIEFWEKYPVLKLLNG